MPVASNVRKRHSFAKIPQVLEMPHLLDIQKESFNWLVTEGIKEVFDEISPIKNPVAEILELSFTGFRFGEPKTDERECREKDLTYSRPLYVDVEIVNRETGEIRTETDVFMGDFPWMTSKGTFIINGTERVVVSQLIRSPGVYFLEGERKLQKKSLYTAKVIPSRGAWLEFEVDVDGIVYARIDRRRRFLATTFLWAIGFSSRLDSMESLLGLAGSSRSLEELQAMFAEVLKLEPMARTLRADFQQLHRDAEPFRLEAAGEISRISAAAAREIFSKLRPEEIPTDESSRAYLENLYFNADRYDLARVGRYKLNHKLGLSVSEAVRVLTPEDILKSIEMLARLYQGDPLVKLDDIDHLGNRRVRAVGELLQNQFRTGMLRIAKYVSDRMVHELENPSARKLINIKPLTAAIREFFGSSQLSQFMDQTNTLTGLTHRRRLSALGPGGLSREVAMTEVRDVNPSHYGRICPIETPEGPNIGLISTLTTYARIDSYGLIETPYRKVINGRVTDTIEFLTADEEEKYAIAPANTPYDWKTGKFAQTEVYCRKAGDIVLTKVEDIDYIDLSPMQIVSVAASLIPFLEHNDVNRALMGANMQRQAVPLVRPEAPLIGTGVEHRAVVDTGDVVLAQEDGEVVLATSERIVVKPDASPSKLKEYRLAKYERTNQGTCYNQRPYVKKGDRVKAGDVLADGPSSDGGELALGRNLLVAFMPWEGYNYEDAIIISERVVQEDLLTSIHIEEYEVEARETKLGDEEITREIPGASEEALKNLDEEGIVRIGAYVRPGDILVGKVTPRGESELTPEEKLLRAIFGEKARDVRDTSLKVPHGEGGKVIDVRVFSRENGDELNPGVLKLVRVYVAQVRKISVGDKLAGRHGNKGVISKIVPVEDMPFLEDGTPVDIILNPLGVPSRMNIGQILETHLGWAAARGFATGGTEPTYVESPVFSGATHEEVQEALVKAGLPKSGKAILYDGRTGEPFENPVAVGYIYILKLSHMVDDKIHARSIGPYALVTRQPLGGKAQFGGQRFGEMEVWALEAYGAAHTLQEMLTIKSDDVHGRTAAYHAIVNGENIPESAVPESFKVLVKELQSIGLDVKAFNEAGEPLKLEDEQEVSSYARMERMTRELRSEFEEPDFESLRASFHEEEEESFDFEEEE